MAKAFDPVRLLDRCRKGDQQAWSQLVDAYQSLVYSIPARMRLNSDDCDDVFQATFLALSNNLDRIESAQALPKWLSVTAAREALRLNRIASRATPTDSLDDMLASEEASAEAAALQGIEAEQLRRAVLELPDKCRDLIVELFFGNNQAYDKVSERLSMPVGAIGPTRARCLERLRKDLVEKGFFAEGITEAVDTLL